MPVVPSDGRKAKCRRGQERGRGRFSERPWLVNVVQECAIWLLGGGGVKFSEKAKTPWQKKNPHLELPHAIQCLSDPADEIFLL